MTVLLLSPPPVQPIRRNNLACVETSPNMAKYEFALAWYLCSLCKTCTLLEAFSWLGNWPPLTSPQEALSAVINTPLSMCTSRITFDGGQPAPA